MAQGSADRQALFQDRQMWRLLLARVHPDAGGAHELFLFVCSLKDQLYEEHRVDAAGQGAHLSAWRTTMGSWASRNREVLRKPRRPRRGR
jgi:hypothetical protein